MLPKSMNCQGVLSPQVILKDVGKEDCTFVEMFLCAYCEAEFEQLQVLKKHQESCMFLPPTLETITTPPLRDMCDSPPMMSPVLRSQTHDCSDVNRGLSMENFASMLNLIPSGIAKRNNKQIKVRCDVIEVAPLTPKAPMTPRTPKVLMSQMSRDNEPLSPRFCRDSQIPLSPTLRPRSFSFSQAQALRDEEECIVISESDDSDSVASSDFHENELPKSTQLLSIDISSPLGQRIQKHINADDLERSNRCGQSYETFCRTPVKNAFMDKLRYRGSEYPVTYRVRKRYKHCHQYRFTASERYEFNRTYDTGLSKRSRRLKRLVRPCRVHIHRLTSQELKKYARPERIPVCNVNCLSQSEIAKWVHPQPTRPVYPAVPCIKLPQLASLLGLKTQREFQSPRNLTVDQLLSESQTVELKQQKVVLYRSLLKEGDNLNGEKTNPDDRESEYSDVELVDWCYNQNVNVAKALKCNEMPSPAVTVVDEDISFISRDRSPFCSASPNNRSEANSVDSYELSNVQENASLASLLQNRNNSIVDMNGVASDSAIRNDCVRSNSKRRNIWDTLPSEFKQPLNIEIDGHLDPSSFARRRPRWNNCAPKTSPSSTCSSTSFDSRKSNQSYTRTRSRARNNNSDWLDSIEIQANTMDYDSDSTSIYDAPTFESAMSAKYSVDERLLLAKKEQKPRLRKFSDTYNRQTSSKGPVLAQILTNNNNSVGLRNDAKRGGSQSLDVNIEQRNISSRVSERQPVDNRKSRLKFFSSENRQCPTRSPVKIPRTRSLCSTVLRSGKKISSPLKNGVSSHNTSASSDDDVIFVEEVICIDN